MNAYKKERAAMMKKCTKVAKKPRRDCELCKRFWLRRRRQHGRDEEHLPGV